MAPALPRSVADDLWTPDEVIDAAISKLGDYPGSMKPSAVPCRLLDSDAQGSKVRNTKIQDTKIRMLRPERSHRRPDRSVRRVMLAAAAMAIVASFGPITKTEARCKTSQSGSHESSAVYSPDSSPSPDTTLTRLQQRYDCSRSMQATFRREAEQSRRHDADSQGDRLFQESGADAMGVRRAIRRHRS